MEDVSALAPEAGPEAVVTEAPKGEEQGQVQESQAAEGDEPEEKRTERQKRRDREKAALDRLRSEAAEARAREQKAQAEAERWRKEVQSLRVPTEQEFPDPLEYTAEKAGANSEKRLLEREAKNAGEAAEAAKREAETISQRESAIIAEAWTAQVAEAKGKYADFDQVALANDLTVTKAMGELIMTSDAGPDVLYYLGQNRALAAQIAAMNPAEAARVIGRIEERVMSQAPKPRTETKAPAPINPVRGSAGASRNPENMSYVEWVKWRENGGKVT